MMIQPDPMLQQQQEQAKQDKILAIQDQLKGDSASLMARFGGMMGMTGGSS